jgi:enamine deaminase RidA (YjgF/YER057c/UK114 family)
MTDLKNFSAFDEVWNEFFKVPQPRTTVGTTGLLVKGFFGGDRFGCDVCRAIWRASRTNSDALNFQHDFRSGKAGHGNSRACREVVTK